MNILKRIGAAFTRQIERENKVTSVNTAAVMTVQAAPDWEVIADELKAAVACAIEGNSGWLDMGIEASNKYQVAKQAKP